MNQSLHEDVQQRRDGLFRKTQTKLQGEGQGGRIFSALEQEAALVQTHAQNPELGSQG